MPSKSLRIRDIMCSTLKMNTESESLPRPGWTYSDQRWQGFLSPIDVTIDLGSVQDVHYVGGTFMQLIGPGVFMPEKVDIYVSEDG